MSRFYIPTPDPGEALPPRPPPPVDDNEEEPPPERPPLPSASGPSRPPPPGVSSVGKSPSRSAAQPASEGQTRALPVRKVTSPPSSNSDSSSQASSNGSLNSVRFPRSSHAAVTSPSGISNSSSNNTVNSNGGSSDERATTSSLKTSSNSVITERSGDSQGANSSYRLSRSQTWSGKRPPMKSQTAKSPPERPTIMTSASSPAKSVTLRPGTRPPPPSGGAVPPKPNRISRSMSATTDEVQDRPSLRRVASDMDNKSRPAVARMISNGSSSSSLTTSQSSVSSIAEAESEGTRAAPPRPAPVRPAPARPAPPRPAPARPPPAGPPRPAPPPSAAPDKPKPPPMSARPPVHIPTRKATAPKSRAAPSAAPPPPTGQGAGETPRTRDNNPPPPPLGQRMQQRATSVRDAIKRVSPQTRRRSRTERSQEEADVKPQPAADASPNMKKRVWSSIRRVKKRPDPATKPAETARAEPPDELGVLNRMVVQCVSYLNTPRGLNEEGLFRVPGDMTEVGKLRTKFLNGEEVDLSNIMDPNTVAGLLKFHFRELRFSIIPRGEPTKNLLAAMKGNDTDEARQVMENIPQSNLASLRILLELFVKVRDNSEVNKMNSANLGQTCGMAIFHDMGAANSAFVLRFLIDNKEAVLP